MDMTGIPGERRAVGDGRRARLVTQLSSDDGGEVDTALLCQVCADVTRLTGAAIVLLADEMAQSCAGASNDVSSRIEELQFTVGEGPAVDAYRHARPVLEPDLADAATDRWFGFTVPAVEAGVRAVFAFPLHVGAARFGVLSLYRDQAGPLDEDQHADALSMAEVASEAVLLMQADAPAGALAAELAAHTNRRAVVHQAAGIMSVQLDVSVAESLVRLRAYAFSCDRRIVDVANDVAHRRLRFNP
jgi:hypothetical protein